MEIVGWRKTPVDDFKKLFSHICFDIVVVRGIVPDYLSLSLPFVGCGLWLCIVKPACIPTAVRAFWYFGAA